MLYLLLSSTAAVLPQSLWATHQQGLPRGIRWGQWPTIHNV